MKRLGSKKEIVILRSNKGSEAVILSRDDYIKKLLDIISDTFKFKKLSADPKLLREGKFQDFLRKLKVGPSPSKKICDIYLIESPLKMIKNAFYFILKALFALKIV